MSDEFPTRAAGLLGEEAYEAVLYYDDGDDPVAGQIHAGYWTTRAGAEAAIRGRLVSAMRDENPTEGGRWVGYAERGRFVAMDEDDALLACIAEFDRDTDDAPEPVHPEEVER